MSQQQDEQAPNLEPESDDPSRLPRQTLPAWLQGRGALVVTVALMVSGLIFVCLFAILLLRSDDQPARPTPPVVATVPAAAEVLVVGVSDSSTISITLDAPLSLEIAGRSFPLQVELVPLDGVWQPPDLGPENGLWVYGTVVNYVVGISDNEANRALLDRLTSDDQLTLRTRSGAVYSFIFRSREVVPQTTATVFSQTTPGLTVALMGTDSDQRMIVRGRYVAATAPEIVAPAGPAELGQPVQLDDLQLTVTGATFQFDQTAAPPGFDFFLVDFELQNRGAASFDAGQLRLVLRDAFGNQYALNNLASQVGNNPPLFGLVAPGQLVLATAGFQIPSGLRSAQLTWMASRSDTGDQVEVAIPFSESAGPDDVTVELVTAEISLDGTGLVLRGQLANTGTERLIINETELSLDSGGTFYLMLSTSPGFPWIVEPGQTLGYAVTFQRPAALDAIFTVLGRQFQLTNLQ